MGQIVRTLSEDGSCLCAAIDSTDIVNDIGQMHGASRAVQAALGRMASACSLMGCMLKYPNDKLTLRINGGGACGTLTAVSDYKGNVKCCVGNPAADAEDIETLVGDNGTLTVIKDLGLKEPYVGQIPLTTGNIARSLTEYFSVSEQLPTIFELGILFGENGVTKAGGFMLQAVPPISEKTIAVLDETLADFNGVGALLEENKAPEEIALSALAGLGGEVLDKWEAKYKCDCSRERTEAILMSLGQKELEKLAFEQEKTEVCCHFCNKKYVFSTDELLKLLKSKKI